MIDGYEPLLGIGFFSGMEMYILDRDLQLLFRQFGSSANVIFQWWAWSGAKQDLACLKKVAPALTSPKTSVKSPVL